MAVAERWRALGNLGLVVGSAYGAFLSLYVIDDATGRDGAWAVGLVMIGFVLAWQAEGRHRRRAGRVARWEGFADLGAGREGLVWLVVVAAPCTLLLGLSGTGTDSWGTGLVVGPFVGLTAACFLGIVRHFRPHASSTSVPGSVDPP